MVPLHLFHLKKRPLGELQFTGIFTELQFTIINAGQDPQLDDDRTGFVVSSLFEPTIVPEPSSFLLVMLASGVCLFVRKK